MRNDWVGKTMRGTILALALAAAALNGGCLADADRDNVKAAADDGTSNDPGDGDTGTVYNFNTDIAPLFDASCGACHGAGGTSPVLSGSGVYAGIKDVASAQSATYKLIDTTLGSVDSYIYMKIVDDSRTTGGAMPGVPALTTAEIQVIAAWIDQDPPAPETAP